MPDEITPDLTQRVLRIIAETQRKDPSQVTIDSSFEELGIDSMDGVNIVFALENEFNINVPDEEVKNIRSVRDMVEGVRKLVEQGEAGQGATRASRVLMRRVVVTGIGVLCSAGRNRCEFLRSLREGRSGISKIEGADIADLRFQSGGEIKNFVPTEYMGEKAADMIDRFAQFAVAATREAVAHSGIEFTPELRENAAIVTGSCVGGQATENQGFYDVYKMGKTRVHPMTIPKTMANAGASAISLEYGITGPSFTIATACSSSAHAMGQAYLMIRAGMCDFAISGGSEAPFSYGLLKAWEAMRVVSPTVCRPFSRDRNGMILGEGAAILTLESLEHARARGATPIAEIVGFGMSADAHHITQPSSEEAPAKALRVALKDAGIGPGAGGLRECPRHRYHRERRDRDASPPPDFRMSRGKNSDLFDQGDARPYAGRSGSH